MAKISAKSSPFAMRKLVKLRQNSSWIKAEKDALPAAYENKKQAKLNKLLVKYNKQLEKSAFSACNKEEYATAILEEKLQKFDVKQYMKHRAVNHGFAKAVFKAIRNGEDWKTLLVAHDESVKKLCADRAARLEQLEAEKQAFLAKNATSDSAEYLDLKEKLEADYKSQEEALSALYSEKLTQKTAALDEKAVKIDKKIEDVKADLNIERTMPDDVLLSVKGLKMYFGGLKAVDDLSFDVKKGEIFGLIGPNGAGKTTVFNCITRFYNATDGDMRFENKQGEEVDLRSFKVHDVILQGITRTFQNVELVKEISVLDNLLVACTREYSSNLLVQALGLPKLRKEENLLKIKAMKILKFMGLENYAAWFAMGLPYGILKKVEIARALMSDAKLIIMDEPAAGLNDTETAELTELIRRIRDEFNVTILLVEHDMSLVMNVCDTICAISFGKLLAIGTCDEIKKNKAVQEAYLGVEED